MFTNNYIKLEWYKERNKIFKAAWRAFNYLQYNYILAYTMHCEHENVRPEFNLILLRLYIASFPIIEN